MASPVASAPGVVPEKLGALTQPRSRFAKCRAASDRLSHDRSPQSARPGRSWFGSDYLPFRYVRLRTTGIVVEFDRVDKTGMTTIYLRNGRAGGGAGVNFGVSLSANGLPSRAVTQACAQPVRSLCAACAQRARRKSFLGKTMAQNTQNAQDSA
jgi:hypothetical protein